MGSEMCIRDSPSTLFLFITDERNSVIRDGDVFRAIQQDGANVLARLSPLALGFNTETRTYTGSLTSFTQAYFSNLFRRDEIFIYPSSMELSVNGFSIDPDDLQIKIFYSQLR